MSKVIVFGATSGVATGLIRELTKRGITSVPVSRSGSGGAQRIDALDAAAVETFFNTHRDATALVSLIGGKPFQKEKLTPPDLVGNRHLIEACERHGIRRFVLVSTIGAGDSRTAAPWLARLVLGKFMALKTEAEALLRESTLEWTIVRPGHLKNGAATGNGMLLEDSTVSGAIAREDVGALVADVLSRPETIGKIYACIEPRK
ncbi:MAG: NAD-dependent epimerase/dehydratase family protein [Gammaproteobacteria bacterium]|jgi:uncharacterized protein YbjT (DUF2867 family)|nr:NAD-dependent epimerase/dehydratase family protein [Gammaproteobacteria bacterium]